MIKPARVTRCSYWLAVLFLLPVELHAQGQQPSAKRSAPANQSPAGAGQAGGGSGGDGGGGISADEANHPAVLLPQVQVEDWYRPSLDGLGSSGTYENLVLTKLLVPSKPTGFLPAQLLRLQIPVYSTTADNKKGLGDINGFDLLCALNNKTRQVGPGPAFPCPPTPTVWRERASGRRAPAGWSSTTASPL